MEPKTSAQQTQPASPPRVEEKKKKKNHPNKKHRQRYFANVRARIPPRPSKKELRNIGSKGLRDLENRIAVPGIDVPILTAVPIVTESQLGDVLETNIRCGRNRFSDLIDLFMYKIAFVPQMSLDEFNGRIRAGTPFDEEDKCWHQGERGAQHGGGRSDFYRHMCATADMIRGHDVGKNLLEVNQGLWEHSHICHRGTCVNPNHILKESRQVNNDREACRRAGSCVRNHQPPCRHITDAMYESWKPQNLFDTNDERLAFSREHLRTTCMKAAADDGLRRISTTYINTNRWKYFKREITQCRHVQRDALQIGVCRCTGAKSQNRLFWTEAGFRKHWREAHSEFKFGVGNSGKVLAIVRKNDELGPPLLPANETRNPVCIFNELHLQNAGLLQWLKSILCECDRLEDELGIYRHERFCSFSWWERGGDD